MNETRYPGDQMLCIPKCLMISEETCLNDKLIYSENSDLKCMNAQAKSILIFFKVMDWAPNSPQY